VGPNKRPSCGVAIYSVGSLQAQAKGAPLSRPLATLSTSALNVAPSSGVAGPIDSDMRSAPRGPGRTRSVASMGPHPGRRARRPSMSSHPRVDVDGWGNLSRQSCVSPTVRCQGCRAASPNRFRCVSGLSSRSRSPIGRLGLAHCAAINSALPASANPPAPARAITPCTGRPVSGWAGAIGTWARRGRQKARSNVPAVQDGFVRILSE